MLPWPTKRRGEKINQSIDKEGNVNEAIKELAMARTVIASLGQDIATLRSRIEQSELGTSLAKLVDARAKVLVDAKIYDEQARDEALAEYNKTGNKKPFGGAKIKVFKCVDFDAKEALAWSMEHGLCLKLDTTKYKKQALLDDSVPATVTHEPRVQIDKDLSAFLE